MYKILYSNTLPKQQDLVFIIWRRNTRARKGGSGHDRSWYKYRGPGELWTHFASVSRSLEEGSASNFSYYLFIIFFHYIRLIRCSISAIRDSSISAVYLWISVNKVKTSESQDCVLVKDFLFTAEGQICSPSWVFAFLGVRQCPWVFSCILRCSLTS